MRNILENVGAAAIVVVPYLLAAGYPGGYVAVAALACMLPKALHFKAYGLVFSYIAGAIGWLWSII